MIPAGFDYVVAEHPDHAIDLLAKREDAKLLAGGHSLIPAMKLRIARPALLVDVGRIGDLSYIREDGDTVAIGALHATQGRRLGPRSCPSTARSSPTPRVRSAIHRCGIAARSAARSHTAILHPTCLP